MYRGLERTQEPPPRSRRLPPPEAWKEPDRWINIATGKAKKDMKKVHIEPDERGFLFPKNVLDQVVDTFFHEDYDWPYSPGDPCTHPDRHHMHYERRNYDAQHFNGDTTARDFRELPTLIGFMPRQMHNTIHTFTETPAVPELDAMREYLESYQAAYRIFTELTHAAERAVILSKLFRPTEYNLTIDDELLQTSFKENFSHYSQLVEEFALLEEKESYLVTPIERTEIHKPNRAIKKFGEITTSRCVNLMTEIKSHLTPVNSVHP